MPSFRSVTTLLVALLALVGCGESATIGDGAVSSDLAASITVDLAARPAQDLAAPPGDACTPMVTDTSARRRACDPQMAGSCPAGYACLPRGNGTVCEILCVSRDCECPDNLSCSARDIGDGGMLHICS